jgi:hypothetical protein
MQEVRAGVRSRTVLISETTGSAPTTRSPSQRQERVGRGRSRFRAQATNLLQSPAVRPGAAVAAGTPPKLGTATVEPAAGRRGRLRPLVRLDPVVVEVDAGGDADRP